MNLHLDVVEIDELAQKIAEAVDGMGWDEWNRASMDYRVEMTQGAFAALAYIQEWMDR